MEEEGNGAIWPHALPQSFISCGSQNGPRMKDGLAGREKKGGRPDSRARGIWNMPKECAFPHTTFVSVHVDGFISSHHGEHPRQDASREEGAADAGRDVDAHDDVFK